MHITLQGYLIAYSLIFPFIFKVWTFIWLEEAEFFLFQGKYTHPTSQSGKHRQLRLFSSNKLPKKTSKPTRSPPEPTNRRKTPKTSNSKWYWLILLGLRILIFGYSIHFHLLCVHLHFSSDKASLHMAKH